MCPKDNRKPQQLPKQRTQFCLSLSSKHCSKHWFPGVPAVLDLASSLVQGATQELICILQ